MTDRARGTSRPHVVVTDAGRGSALAFIRSLGRQGWDVTAADSVRTSPGFRSRYTSARLLYPDPIAQPAAAVEAIRRATTQRPIDLVIPITDEIGLPLAAARHRFAGPTLALASDAALGTAHDKAATLALARRLDVPIPPTREHVRPEEAVRVAAELGYPVVLKPVSSRVVQGDGTMASHSVGYAGSDVELRAKLGGLEGVTAVLLQRWLPGEGVGVEVLAHEGRLLAAFQHRRIREVPVTGGASALRESVALDPTLLGHATRLIQALGWSGLAMVEFRITPDGQGHLMEINGRVWGSMPLAVHAGMDFPTRWATLLLDGPPPIDQPVATDYQIGVRARNLRLDLAWIGAVLAGRRRHAYLPWPSRRRGLQALGSLVDPRIADDHLSREDPGPAVAQLMVIAGTVAERAGRRHAS